MDLSDDSLALVKYSPRPPLGIKYTPRHFRIPFVGLSLSTSTAARLDRWAALKMPTLAPIHEKEKVTGWGFDGLHGG